VRGAAAGRDAAAGTLVEVASAAGAAAEELGEPADARGADDAEEADEGDAAEDAEEADAADAPSSQVRFGFGPPNAASRFRRASSGGSGGVCGRRAGCWCLPDRRRLRGVSEVGSVMGPILDSPSRTSRIGL